jgi:arylsulfatase A-like enzyme
LLGHALSVYQDVVHVPLLIKYPHGNNKTVVDDPVSLVDLMPTILDALGYAVPANVQGRSLLKREDPGTVRSLISETFVHPFISTLHPRFLRAEQAIFSGSLKLIRSSKGGEELYDLAKDPNELHDLYPSTSTVSLEAQLKRYLTTVNAFERMGALSTRPGSKSVEQLKSLGYIQ